MNKYRTFIEHSKNYPGILGSFFGGLSTFIYDGGAGVFRVEPFVPQGGTFSLCFCSKSVPGGRNFSFIFCSKSTLLEWANANHNF